VGGSAGDSAVAEEMVEVAETAEVMVEVTVAAETAVVMVEVAAETAVVMVEVTVAAETAVVVEVMEAVALFYTSNPPAGRPSMFRRPP